MLAVRCEACGLKALVAASQCPHCSHPLDIRDSFGELLPLVHCSTCDASYPRRDGACRWCGSTPERVNYKPYIWKVAGALVFTAMAVGAWLTRDVPEPRPNVAVQRQDTVLLRALDAVAAAIPETASRAVAVQPAGTIDTTPTALPTTDSTPESLPPVGGAAEGATEAATQVGAPHPPRAVPDAERKAVVTSPPAPVAPSKSPPPRRATPRHAPWTSAVVVSWAVVRASPSKGARLVGSVGPGSRVQIGEVRGDWRRVRMQGLAGWVKGGRFTAARRIATTRRASP